MRANMILSVVLATCFFLCARGDPFELPKELQWLEKFVRDDGTLSFLTGSYSLCLDAPEPAESPECTVNGNPGGHCKLLRYCPALFQQIPDENKFKELFCPLGSCAGVCCPDS